MSKYLPTSWERSPILIHSPNWLGDHVMAFPFYATLRRLFPNNQIHLISQDWVSSLSPPQIFDRSFAFTGKHLEKSQLLELKENQYGLGISLSPSFRSMWFLHRAYVRVLIGYKTDLRGFIMKTPVSIKKYIPPYNQHEHRSLSYIRLLSYFFEENQTAENYWQKGVEHQWDFILSKQEEKNIKIIVDQYKIKPKNYWVICLGSNASSRVYPIEYVMKIIKNWVQQEVPHKIIFVGTHIEKKYVHQMLKELNEREKKDLIDITTKTNLMELIWILQNSRGVLANDSGPAHLTYLTRSPLVSFIGAARKEETLTLANPKEILNERLSCSPCLKQICPRKDFPNECLVRIQPEKVWNSMQKLDPELIEHQQ